MTAFQVVEASTHDLPFALCAFGETMASYGFLFLGSVATGLPPGSTCDLSPMENEAFMPINWQLPMTDEAQTILFQRIQATFDRETTMVPAQSKKKYRLSQEKLQALRNLTCLFAQLFPHIKTRLPPPESEKWLQEFSSSSQRDEDMKFILESQPSSFALSMLPSSRAVAQEQAQQREQSIGLSVEKQRLDVIDAQWIFSSQDFNVTKCSYKRSRMSPRRLLQNCTRNR